MVSKNDNYEDILNTAMKKLLDIHREEVRHLRNLNKLQEEYIERLEMFIKKLVSLNSEVQLEVDSEREKPHSS